MHTFRGGRRKGTVVVQLRMHRKKHLQHSPESLRTIDIQVRPKQNPSKIMSLTDTENQMPSMDGKSIGGSGAVIKENTEITVMLQI